MMPPALAGLRIGCVSYLNAKPLVWALDQSDLVFEVPSRLADSFTAGRLDVALLPLFEILHAGSGRIVDDAAIACQGPVFSVIVASRGALADCREISLDPSSRSSIALLKVLLAEYYPNGPKTRIEPPGPEEARLIIGDPAIAFRASHPDGWQFHDLGALWQLHTGLPFVFAAWALSPHVRDVSLVSKALRETKERGLAARPEIAAREPDQAKALDYLTHSIRYGIGPAEKQAIDLFASLAHKHGLLPEPVGLSYS